METVAKNNALVSGFTSLIGGGNNSVEPLLVSDAEFSRGLNVSVRKGFVTTRPRFIRKSVMADGRMQGAFAYRRNGGDRLVAVLGGTAYALKMDDLTIETWKASAFNNTLRCYFVKADRFCVIQNGNDAPVIFDGPDNIGDQVVPSGVYLKANGTYMTGTYSANFPKGYIMAYAHGRIFLQAKNTYDNNGNVNPVEDGRPYFLAGDVVLSYRPQNCLVFTETDYLNEGGAFSLPEDYGFIYGMLPFRNAQTAQGVGSLIVMCRDGIASYQVNTARSQWKEIDLSTILFSNNGTFSPFSLLNVNDDIIYRGGRVGDGIRAIRYTVTEVAAASGSLSNTPISSEIQYVMDMDSEEDLKYVSSAAVNNRIFMTTGGRDDLDGFKAVAVIDANTASRIKQKASPVYNGIWTGLSFQQIVQARYDGQDRLFAMHRNGPTNEVWMLDEDGNKDGDETPILCRVYTKAMPFAIEGRTSIQDLKRFHYLDLYLKDIMGDVSIQLYYRPYGHPLWTRGGSHQISADESGLSQMRDPIRLSSSSEESVEATGRLTEVASVFEFCIEWRGRMTIQEALFVCTLHSIDDDTPIAEAESEVKVEATAGQIELDDFAYVIGG